MKKYLPIFLLIPLSSAGALNWEIKNNILQSLTSDLRVYSPQAITASLGEVVAAQVDMSFFDGAYIGTCDTYNYVGVQNDAILLAKTRAIISSKTNSLFFAITGKIIEDPSLGYAALRASCLTATNVITTELSFPMSWKSAPLPLRDLVVSFEVQPDYRLKATLKTP